jgi:hypothetical protein
MASDGENTKSLYTPSDPLVSVISLVGPSRTSEGSSAPVKDREALSRFGRLMTDFFVDSTKPFRVSVLIVCKTSRREPRFGR